MSSKRLETIADFVRHRYRLRVDCLACGRVVVLEPLPILELCQARGWPYRLAVLEPRLVCAECGSRRVRCGPAFGD